MNAPNISEIAATTQRNRGAKKMPARTPHTKAEKGAAVHEVMSEFKHKTLHSGSKTGPKVKSRKQAIAIAMSESNQSKKPKKNSVPPRTGPAPPRGGGESKPGYDRSGHFPGNPGFKQTKGSDMGNFKKREVAHVGGDKRGSELQTEGNHGAGHKKQPHGKSIGQGYGPNHTNSGGPDTNIPRREVGFTGPTNRLGDHGGSPWAFRPSAQAHASGFRHEGGQKGQLRMSGTPGAHRIGSRGK